MTNTFYTHAKVAVIPWLTVTVIDCRKTHANIQGADLHSNFGGTIGSVLASARRLFSEKKTVSRDISEVDGHFYVLSEQRFKNDPG